MKFDVKDKQSLLKLVLVLFFFQKNNSRDINTGPLALSCILGVLFFVCLLVPYINFKMSAIRTFARKVDIDDAN